MKIRYLAIAREEIREASDYRASSGVIGSKLAVWTSTVSPDIPF